MYINRLVFSNFILFSFPYQHFFTNMKTSTFAATTLLSISVVLAEDNPYTQYPSVQKTATMNGFADPIFDKVPKCAQDCLTSNISTGNTPCPYWDTGCLCVMPQFGGPIAQCIADNCKGENVGVATQAAVDACSKAGVWEPYWMFPDSIKAALSSAAANTEGAASATTTSSEAETTQEPKSTEVPAQTSTEPEASTSAPEVTSAPVPPLSTESQESQTTEAPIPESSAGPESQAPESVPEPAPESSAAEPVIQSSATGKEISSDAPKSSTLSKTSTKEMSSSSSQSPVKTVEQVNAGQNNFPALAGTVGGVFAALAILI